MSTDGTDNIILFPFVSLKLNSFKSVPTALKLGALSPTFTLVPSNAVSYTHLRAHET